MQGAIIRFILNAAGLYLATQLVPGIHLQGPLYTVLLVALIFGVVNALLHPLLSCSFSLLGLLAAFVALDQWRTAQPALTQAMLPPGATTAAVAGRNTPQPRTHLGIIPGHNRVRKVGGEFERVLEPDPVTGMPPDPGATCR